MSKVTKFVLAILFAVIFSLMAQAPAQQEGTTQEGLAFAEFLFENNGNDVSFNIFHELAMQGNMEAMAWLGRCYFNGLGTPIDYDKAFECFSLAAKENIPWAFNGLGACYNHGLGVTKDLTKALEYFQRADELGLPLAALNLARTYASMSEGRYDAEKAEFFLQKAMGVDASKAAVPYAIFLYREGRYDQAVTLFKAYPNDMESMRYLMSCYENGLGTPVNIPAAVEIAERFGCFGRDEARIAGEVLFNAAIEEKLIQGETERYSSLLHKSADFGNSDATMRYASLLAQKGDKQTALEYLSREAENLIGPDKVFAATIANELGEKIQAIRWLLSATEDPSSEASAVPLIADIYRYDWNVDACRHWESRGCELGDSHCRNQVAWGEIQTGVPNRIARGIMLLLMSVQNGDQAARDIINDYLGQYYEGILALADMGEANALAALGMYGCSLGEAHPSFSIGLELLEKSAEKQSPEACNYLGTLYYNGLGGNPDIPKSLEYYEKGASFGDTWCAGCVCALLYYNGDKLPEISLEEYKRCFDRCLNFGKVGLAYEYGVILENKGNDAEGAQRMYALAAASGDDMAMLRMHDLLFQSDYETSIYQLRQACLRGNPQAHMQNGCYHEFYMKNYRRAFVSYAQSYMLDPKNASSYYLALCFLNGIGCVPQSELALKYAQVAYGNGIPESCSLLGDIYREGKIVARDANLAKSYYEEGVKRGDNASRKALGLPEISE